VQSQFVDGFGVAHFLSQTDLVGRLVLLVLLLLSLASWYLIISRSLASHFAQRRAKAFLARFWSSRSEDLRRRLQDEACDHAFARLAAEGLDALADSGDVSLAAAGGFAEYLSRRLGHVIDDEAAAAEYGLTMLASAASAAPYIGLFGTVWGIYHALVQIGLSGQGTLDKVAGPVGEALIMTALGLVVAIPAVLAHNAFNRRNRLWLARLEGFAHELYVLLTVKGVAADAAAAQAPAAGR
jgi:biopolymer transport protein ExbB